MMPPVGSPSELARIAAAAGTVPAPRPCPRPGRLQRLRAEIRTRIASARALERVGPERFGFDAAVAARLFLVTAVLYRHYFRTQCFGLENLPPGPVLLVANHGSHALAWDGANVVTACLLDASPPRLAHGMAHHRLMGLPILGTVARRIGAVDGHREACMSLLRAGATVLTFPEGTRAADRSFHQRYDLAPFGHGFMHVALRTRVPVVPVAVIGCEEEAPLLANPAWLRRLLRTPTAPITATLVLPLPVRYRIHFGTPLRPGGPATPRRVTRLVDEVRRTLAALLADGLARREHVFR
jgi:1-acyl-sn-glycerol-3-phosphate acyltransferase